MEPAYPFTLTQQDHALIGELAEIIGQIDSIMIETVVRLEKRPSHEEEDGLWRSIQSRCLGRRDQKNTCTSLRYRSSSRLQRPM